MLSVLQRPFRGSQEGLKIFQWTARESRGFQVCFKEYQRVTEEFQEHLKGSSRVDSEIFRRPDRVPGVTRGFHEMSGGSRGCVKGSQM